MIWYGLPPGQIKTLRRMMLHPFDFDPVDYIEKTLYKSDTQPSEETITLANEFNRLREKLLPSVGQIYFNTSNTARFTIESIAKKPKSLDYKLLNSIFSTQLNTALSIQACDSINIQIDKISDSFEINEHHGTEPNENFTFLARCFFFCYRKLPPHKSLIT